MSTRVGSVCTRSMVANSSKRYPLIVQNAARIEGSAIIDAEVVWFDSEGTPDFDVLYSGVSDGEFSARAFDLLMLNGEDFRCKPYVTAKQRCESLCSTVAAPSTSSTPKVMATGCLRQTADLVLRASFLRNWMRPIVRDRRKPGSKSKTRRPPLQPVHLV